LWKEISSNYLAAFESLSSIGNGKDTRYELSVSASGPVPYPIPTTPSSDEIALEAARFSALKEFIESVLDWEPELEGVEDED
jgi:hypothetical protein